MTCLWDWCVRWLGEGGEGHKRLSLPPQWEISCQRRRSKLDSRFGTQLAAWMSGRTPPPGSPLGVHGMLIKITNKYAALTVCQSLS